MENSIQEKLCGIAFAKMSNFYLFKNNRVELLLHKCKNSIPSKFDREESCGIAFSKMQKCKIKKIKKNYVELLLVKLSNFDSFKKNCMELILL